jgi:hypothetical protein
MEIPAPTHMAWRRAAPWRLFGLLVFLLVLTPVFGQRFAQRGSKLIGADAAGRAGQGSSVALSAGGNVAVMGEPSDQVPPTQVEGIGAVWVFVWSGGEWHQLGTKFVGSGGSRRRLNRSPQWHCPVMEAPSSWEAIAMPAAAVPHGSLFDREMTGSNRAPLKTRTGYGLKGRRSEV